MIVLLHRRGSEGHSSMQDGDTLQSQLSGKAGSASHTERSSRGVRVPGLSEERQSAPAVARTASDGVPPEHQPVMGATPSAAIDPSALPYLSSSIPILSFPLSSVISFSSACVNVSGGQTLDPPEV